MSRHSSGNRAAVGGTLAVFGFFLVLMEGYLRIAGVLFLLAGVAAVAFAFLRRR
jgi:hypothetical protein